MKKAIKKAAIPVDDEMLPEYDLRDRKGVRGKYAAAMRNGYSVRVINQDGTLTVTKYPAPRDTIILDPDVRKYFPDSASVNETLRSLISLIPANIPSAKTRRGRSRNATAKKVRN